MGSHNRQFKDELPVVDDHDHAHTMDEHSVGLASQGLKRTCEECTKSKVRCSGPEKGVCDRCAQRRTECVFRNKMKRGPQTAAKPYAPKKPKDILSPPSGAEEHEEYEEEQTPLAFADKGRSDSMVDYTTDLIVPIAEPSTTAAASQSSSSAAAAASAFSSDEVAMALTSSNPGAKMSWHERRCWSVFFSTFKQQNRKENPTSWCWFALQIDKLRKDLERMKNQTALDRMESWMSRLHTKVSYVSEQTNQQCVFAPHLCAGCSSAALIGRIRPSTYRTPADMTGASSAFFSSAGKPFVEFEMDAEGARLNEVNDLFVTVFGHTKQSLLKTMSWIGGGGFLPWGGDLIARLLWSEADVLIFLQVLAVKFQALGPPKHDHEDPFHVLTREVLSAYIFDVRVANGQNTFQEMVLPCMIKSLHRETLVGSKLKITVLLEFDVLGPLRAGPETPESVKEAMEQCKCRQEEQAASVEQQMAVQTPRFDFLSLMEKPSNVPKPDSVVVPTPQQDLALVDPDWDLKLFDEDEKSIGPLKLDRETSVLSASTDMLKSDETWLSSLLEWTDDMANF